ncbi:DUF302 domain-containing protein [Mucilaginibacter aquaedulcis]|uniref:DUF302 domain-containing protein n=1 Tax=Mucilaginibacter aquaedulcis TaxID=1187081 RepID=UPI0025B38D05|nr:DUF302 domain-containing protein [Mucilaginibacter aquaedulcis]MDN3549261.1 DUF302 domain-containing protein [Mucilaginibacter aquaedulcis]
MLNEKQDSSLKTPADSDRRSFIKQAVAACFFVVLPFKDMVMSNPTGVTVRKSQYSVKETINRLQAALEQHNITIYARIDQQAELQKAGQAIAPLEYLLFGNPKAGGPVMIENPMAALDLPLKVIAWQDEHAVVHIAYNDASYIKNRYALSTGVTAPLAIDELISKLFS